MAANTQITSTGIRYPDNTTATTRQITAPTGPPGPTGPTGPAGPPDHQGARPRTTGCRR